jgi:hypothetical protein
MRLSLIPLALLPLAKFAISSQADSCTPLPSWTVSNLTIHSEDAVGSNGTASFSLTYNSTGEVDVLNCTLVANYRCAINGPPGDKNLNIDLQARIDIVYVSLTEPYTCNDANTTS